MREILHNLDIGAAPQAVFNALSTEAGLSGWWTTRVTAEEEPGGTIDFTFGATFNPTMEITALEAPKLVSWKCVGGHEPWLDSSFEFRIESRGGGSILFFSQAYGRELSDEAYGRYNYNWGYYLDSLRKLVETGSGTPYSAPTDADAGETGDSEQGDSD